MVDKYRECRTADHNADHERCKHNSEGDYLASQRLLFRDRLLQASWPTKTATTLDLYPQPMLRDCTDKDADHMNTKVYMEASNRD